MTHTQLSSSEIQDLINRYNSELKKLVFQLEEVEQIIEDLESLKESVEAQESKAAAKSSGRRVRMNRDLKVGSKTRSSITRHGAGKPVVGYKLSVWDQDVIDSIKKAGRALITQEIIDYVSEADKKRGVNSANELIRKKVTRSLQKLANRRGDIAKVSYPGKGFAYALPDWINIKGKLAKEYQL